MRIQENDLVYKKNGSKIYFVVELGTNYTTGEPLVQIAPIEDKDQIEWVKLARIEKRGAK